MKSAEAERRFSNLLDNLSPSALQFAWVYHKTISRNVLNGLMNYFGKKEPYHTYLLFMLSEAGDDSAYQELKKAYYHKDQELTKADYDKLMLHSSYPQIYDELIKESVRRQDYFAIRQQAKYLITKLGLSQNAVLSPTEEREKLFMIHNLNPEQITAILTPLIKSDVKNALAIIEWMQLNNASVHKIILDACIQANNAQSESILQKIASYFESSNQSNPETRRTDDIWRKWVTALQVTNTAWCRDRVVESADYAGNVLYILADMGDKRALTLHRKMTNDLNWLSLIKLGGTSEFKSRYAERNCIWICQQNEQYAKQPDYFHRPATLLDISTWKPEHIKNAQTVLLDQFRKMPSHIRFCMVYETAATKTLWSDQLALQALNDSYAPVRLAMLQILLHYPRPSLTSEIKRIRDNDPMPWCRRFAKEILLFQPDPFYQDKGIYMPI